MWSVVSNIDPNIVYFTLFPEKVIESHEKDLKEKVDEKESV